MVDSYEDWSERRGPRRSEGRPEPRLEQRLDQWVSAGRQLVDGVSGARPGSRPGGRLAAGRTPGLRLDQVGRWVEDKIDWLLEDEDGWRESWEEVPGRRSSASSPEPPAVSRRRPLDAISRRSPRGQSREQSREQPPAVSSAPLAGSNSWPEDDSWPDDDNFSVNRWRRGDERPPAASQSPFAAQAPSLSQPLDAAPGRALPRSTRRRSL